MQTNKYNFILELVRGNKLSSSQKDRLLELSALEFKRGASEFDERLSKIEEVLKEEILEENQSEDNKVKPLPRPKETYELLSFFSSTDGGIKNLTHSFNYGYISYDDLMQKCKEEFNEGKIKYPNVPIPLLRRIEEFAFSEKPNWYIKRGKEKHFKTLGWSSPEFVEWYKTNKIHPVEHAYYNTEMIIPFKETIQVRADLGNLINIINELSENVFENAITVNIRETVNSAQFYTDVDQLGSAIYYIFIAIKNISLKNFCDTVEIDFEIDQETRMKLLKITHIDSTTNKSINDFDFLGGDLKSVREQLWGLCNYDIMARFNEGSYRKIILSDNSKEFEKINNNWIGKNYSINDNDIKGFTHILKFY